MRRIGLLGGTSWPSTIEYYRILNQLVQERLGGHHSANVLLWSIDYHEIKSRYDGDRGQIPSLLEGEITKFLKCHPDCLLICNNTLHEVLDEIRPRLQTDRPIIHMAELTASRVKVLFMKRVLLLGTRYTMERGYYSGLINRAGVDAVIPSEPDRVEIQIMQAKISRGETSPEFTNQFKQMLDRYTEVDGIITACTELPLVVTTEITAIPILDPMRLQCEAAVEFAMS